MKDYCLIREPHATKAYNAAKKGYPMLSRMDFDAALLAAVARLDPMVTPAEASLQLGLSVRKLLSIRGCLFFRYEVIGGQVWFSKRWLDHCQWQLAYFGYAKGELK